MKLFVFMSLVVALFCSSCSENEPSVLPVQTLEFAVDTQLSSSTIQANQRLDSILGAGLSEHRLLAVVSVRAHAFHDAAYDESISRESLEARMSLGDGYWQRERYAVLELEVVDVIRGNGRAALELGSVFRATVAGVCPGLENRESGTEVEDGRFEATDRSWGTCIYIDPNAAGGTAELRVSGQFPVNLNRAVPDARGVAYIWVADPSYQDVSLADGGLLSFLQEDANGPHYDASFFLEEPERKLVSHAELLGALEQYEAAARAARVRDSEGGGPSSDLLPPVPAN